MKSSTAGNNPGSEAQSSERGVRKGPPFFVLFDGVCNFCSDYVQFLIQRDPEARLKFGALQTPEALALLRANGVPSLSELSTLVFIEDGRVYTRSTAVLRLVRHLSGAWPMLTALLVVPPPLRNLVYAWFARHRYRWFGKKDQCMIPSPEQRARFL